jgi:HK97 family phage prohead protease
VITNRAYALLNVKDIDEDERIITGMATTPTPDRMGDIVEPDGAEFKLPIPLLWQHDSRQPVGHVIKAKVTKDGIEVTAKFVKFDEPGNLKNRLDEAWQSVKVKLVQGLSIGFKSLETSRIEDSFSLRFIKWLWLELSVVTIPANQDATIAAVKAIDSQVCADLARAKTAPVPAGKPRQPVIFRAPVKVYPIKVIPRGQ